MATIAFAGTQMVKEKLFGAMLVILRIRRSSCVTLLATLIPINVSCKMRFYLVLTMSRNEVVKRKLDLEKPAKHGTLKYLMYTTTPVQNMEPMEATVIAEIQVESKNLSGAIPTIQTLHGNCVIQSDM